EVKQLKDEIQRVADTTNFNGTNLLDGSFTAQVFQVGADQGQTISIAGIANANIDELGTYQSVEVTGTAIADDATNPLAAIADGTITINDVEIGGVAEVAAGAGNGATRANDLITAINEKSGQTGV